MPRDCPATSEGMAPTATRTSRKFRAQSEVRSSTSPAAGAVRSERKAWAPWAPRDGSTPTAKAVSSPAVTMAALGTGGASRVSVKSLPPRACTRAWATPRPPATSSTSSSVPTRAWAPTSTAAAAAASASGASSSCNEMTQQGARATALRASSRHRCTSSSVRARTAMTSATCPSEALFAVSGSPSASASAPRGSQRPRGSAGTSLGTRWRSLPSAATSSADISRPSMQHTTAPEASSNWMSTSPSLRRALALAGADEDRSARRLTLCGTPRHPRGCSSEAR
mmetsp:Transcript_11661/g.34560  ORF Transcript_11661/g.34560 Transcript_11661/m.34560 type:complete len:282 (+) Transcript_11661:1319-2164(+)